MLLEEGSDIVTFHDGRRPAVDLACDPTAAGVAGQRLGSGSIMHQQTTWK